MIKLSVIVIIYKAEEYLRQCIDSVLAQTYKDFELILVDDESPDGCYQICDEYAKKDKRVKVIHQKNQGPIMARWNGILASKGEYISLIDDDDWLDANMYEQMIDLAKFNDADIVITGYKEGLEGKYEYKKNKIKSGLYKGDRIIELYKEALYTGKFYEPGVIPALWNKLIKRDLFFENFMPADSNVIMGEDATVSYPMIARAKSIVIDNEIFPYNYRVVQGSMSRKYDPKYFSRCTKLFETLSRNLAENEEMNEDLKYYALFIIEIGFLQLCSRQSSLSLSKQKEVAMKFYKEYSHIGIVKDYDWYEVGENKIWLKHFIQGHIKRMLCALYFKKLVDKVIK